MNSHYVYPPPGYVYILPPGVQPSYIVPDAPQYGALPSPEGLNGHHVPYPHPHPHPHHLPPSPSHPTMPQSSAIQVDSGGWYTPQSLSNTPLHPPGLDIPLNKSREDEPMAKLSSDIHEFWRGRLAPLPGYRSRPVLLPMRGTTPVVGEQTPAKKVTPIGLLPPHSFFGSEYERSLTTPTTPLREDTSLIPKEEIVSATYLYLKDRRLCSYRWITQRKPKTWKKYQSPKRTEKNREK